MEHPKNVNNPSPTGLPRALDHRSRRSIMDRILPSGKLYSARLDEYYGKDNWFLDPPNGEVTNLMVRPAGDEYAVQKSIDVGDGVVD